MNYESKLIEAIGDIAWYNNHLVWLEKLADDLEKHAAYGFSYIPDEDEYLTDRHCLWMLLVGMFGNWGTSIRAGWIEDWEGCLKFIREVLERNKWELEEQRKSLAEMAKEEA